MKKRDNEKGRVRRLGVGGGGGGEEAVTGRKIASTKADVYPQFTVNNKTVDTP